MTVLCGRQSRLKEHKGMWVRARVSWQSYRSGAGIKAKWQGTLWVQRGSMGPWTEIAEGAPKQG